MRSRQLRPGSFILNELLGEVSFGARLLAAGLWLIADRDGRMERRSGVRLRAEVFPYDSGLSGGVVDGYLDELIGCGFAELHVVHGREYVLLPQFSQDQSPHHTEAKSKIPQLDSTTKAPNVTVTHGEFTVKEIYGQPILLTVNGEKTGDVDADGLGGEGGVILHDQCSVISNQSSEIRGSEGGMAMLGSLQHGDVGSTPNVTVTHGESAVNPEEELELESQGPEAPAKKGRSRRVVPSMYRWDEFCAGYPEHRRKFTTKAEKIWDGLVAGCGSVAEADLLVDEILAGLALWVASYDWTKERGKFVPNPWNFLDGKEWRARPVAGNTADGQPDGKRWFDDENAEA